MSRHFTRRLAVVLCGLSLIGCADSPTGARRAGASRLTVRADVSASIVSALAVSVSAPDIATPIVANLTISNGIASGTLDVPAGAARTITVRAFDVMGIETHRGAVTADVREGVNPPLAITLAPVAGQQPVQVVVGSATVAVSPGTVTLSGGSSRQLTATITASDGTPVVGAVIWSTLDPAVATVGLTGLVTTHASGQARIIASFAGYAGQSIVTVP